MNKNAPQALLYVASMLMALTLSACNVSTANIGSLTTSKEKNGAANSVFAAGEAIHATATAKNLPGKVTIKWSLSTIKVEGQPDNTVIPEADMAVELAGDGSSNYFLTPPPNGFPTGTYEIEATMIGDAGKQEDQKSATVTVNGR